MDAAGPSFEDIPRREGLSVSEFRREYLSPGRPVVVVGALASWPALGRWTPGWFADRLRGRRLRAFEMECGHVKLHPQLGFVLRDLDVDTFVREIQRPEGPSVYLRRRFGPGLPEIWPDVRRPAHCGRLRVQSNLWFGGAGTISQLHYDLPQNLICQVYGRKRYVLFAPSEGRALYRYSRLSSRRTISPVDPEFPDLDRFPRLAVARGARVTIEPGDMLYVPKRWWHHARALTPTISVNWWWSDPADLPLRVVSDAYTLVKRMRGLDV